VSDVPVWLLDVDGVINAPKPPWHEQPRRLTAYADGCDYRIRYAPALVAKIGELHVAGVVEVVWCTTWCSYPDQLRRLERLWGWPELRRAFTDVSNHPELMRIAKHDAACDAVGESRRLIWTDDVEVPTSGDLYDDLMFIGRRNGVLLIKPDDRHGLTPAHLELIERFACGTLGQLLTSASQGDENIRRREDEEVS
jgi:hypothetical protein